ncbi:MAG: LD-carboxypeptidase, partial [Bacteroidetes bacterium]|nr:LD-carboxypeptidase [Bacteroidota bacterium]
MTSPPYLKKGDKIGIVATAIKVSANELKFAIETLTSWGLEVVLGKNLYASENQFSGSDEQRTSDFQEMLDDSSIKAVISARGGYGTIRIIDKLDFSGFQRNPKWIIGYSDITVLHCHLQNLGFESIHATMPINFKTNAEATESLRKSLFGENLTYTVPAHPLNRMGDS